MPKNPAVLLTACALACLSACGMKGPLELPPGPPPEPLLGNPKPAAKPAASKPAESTPKDLSTDKNTSSQ